MQWHHPTLSTRCFLTLDILSNVNKIKATEHFFLVALLIMLYKVVLTFESVDEILWCDHSNKSYWAVPSRGIVNYSVEGLIVETADEILWCDHSVKATEQYFPVVLFIMLYKVVQTFESVDETTGVTIQRKANWAVLSCGTVDYAVQGGSNVWVCGWNPMVRPFEWSCASYEAKLG